MQLTKLKIKNYKGIRDLEQNLNGNVFIVKGDNEVGKSTFAKAFLKLVTKTEGAEEPVTKGEDNGIIRGDFVDANNGKWTVICEFTNEKETIKMVSPEGITTTKVGEIRQLFDYNYVDVDQFIAWSTTAEGRRKQRDTVLKLLPKEALAKFLELEQIEKTKYAQRTTESSTVKAQESVVQRFILTDEELVLYKSYTEKEQVLTELCQKEVEERDLHIMVAKLKEDSIAVGKDYNQAVKEHDEEIANWPKIEKEKLDEIAELERKLIEKKESLKIATESHKDFVNKKLSLIQSYADDLAKIDKEYNQIREQIDPDINTKIAAAQEEFDKVKNVAIKFGNYNTERVVLDTAKQKVDDLTTEIESARVAKQSVVVQAELPIKGLSIEEDGIKLNGLPFTKEQLSTSQIMSAVFHILVALNPKTPIIYLGRAESLGTNKLETIINEAFSHNCQLFIDQVVSGQNLAIEIVEEKPIS